MALFAVSRYLGDDEEVKKKPKPEASEILEKLKKDAKARKKLKHKEVKHDSGSQESELQLHTTIEKDSIDECDLSGKSKKKKRKHKDSETEPIQPDNVQKDEKIVDEQQSSHKKRKKDKEETSKEVSDNNVTMDAPAEDESKDEEKPSELNETLGDEQVKEQEGEGGSQERRRGHRVIGGFTVIGRVREAKIEKVKRVLPDWLANPTVISADVSDGTVAVTDMPGLATDLVQRLQENNIHHFFPVQMTVIPALLRSSMSGYHTGRAGYRPSDICVSAPTGSGKTLAFVLPIVQFLRERLTCEVRALAVLPVTDLATQVYKVFQAYCKGSCLKVGLLTGQKTLAVEQQALVKKTLSGYRCQYDIIVVTPGRLVDHLNRTPGFSLAHLRYLVIDEADRMMNEIKHDWLTQVESAVYKHRQRPGPLTAASCQQMDLPLQKLLYSATLSQNPEKLQELNLFQPLLYTSVISARKSQPSIPTSREQGDKTTETENVKETSLPETTDKSASTGEFVGKYSTPASLTEYYIETTVNQKPLVVLHLLHNLQYRNILCFANSVEATHRLFLLIKLVGGVTVKEFSSNLHVARRDAILNKFVAGKIDILVCSDAMARGMDISNVKYVVSYDPPVHIQNYIHRIGRTARAGQQGTAFTLLQKKEFFHFKKMLRESGKHALRPLTVTKQDMKPLVPKYEPALEKLSEILEAEKLKRTPRPQNRRRFNVKEAPENTDVQSTTDAEKT